MRTFDSGILLNRIGNICPVDSISIGSIADKSTWSVIPSASATPQQITALNAFLANTDPSTPTIDEQLENLVLSPKTNVAMLFVCKAIANTAGAPAWVINTLNAAAQRCQNAISGTPSGSE